MNWLRLIIATMLSLVLAFLVLFAYVYQMKKRSSSRLASDLCQVDEDCPGDQRCVVDPEDSKQNVCAEGHMIKCQLTDLTKLIECDPANPNSCSSCVNQPPFKCVVVQYGSPELINRGTGYSSGIYRAALVEPSTNTYNINRDMEVAITVSNTTVGSIDQLRITHPTQIYKKSDTFVVLGGNNGATFRLTETPTPYFWQKGQTKLNLPESNKGKGWCLPPVTQSAQCNPYTSDSVLVQKIDNAGKITYEWGCYCKLPSLMQHEDTPTSNCSALVGCGGYDLYVPNLTSPSCRTNADCPDADTRCCTDEKCLRGSETFTGTNTSGKCYKRWVFGNTTQNPRDGTCDCPSNLYYSNAKIGDYVVKTCNADPCGPNGTKDGASQFCTCKPGFVSCGLQSGSGIKVTDARCATVTTRNRCLPDPCAPGGTMRQGGGCNCDAGYAETSNPNVIGGKVCRKLCVNNGPCGTRGTCKVVNNTEECDCICPYTASAEADKFCSLRTITKSREGEQCRTTARTETDWVTQKSWEVLTPVADSCCGSLKCQMPGPVCVKP